MSLQWSGANMSLATFVDGHAHSLPNVICVTGGFAGADELHCISSGEVSFSLRAVATGEYIGLPVITGRP